MQDYFHTQWLGLIASSGHPHAHCLVPVGNRQKAMAIVMLPRRRASEKLMIRFVGKVLRPSSTSLVASCDWPWQPFAPQSAADGAHARILDSFADAIGFFVVNIDSTRFAAKRLARLLARSSPLWHSNCKLSSVVMLTEPLPRSVEAEAEVLEVLQCMLEEKTAIDSYRHFSSLGTLTICPKRAASPSARYSRLKKHIVTRSNRVRSRRRTARTLLSAFHSFAPLQGGRSGNTMSNVTLCNSDRTSTEHRPSLSIPVQSLVQIALRLSIGGCFLVNTKLASTY